MLSYSNLCQPTQQSSSPNNYNYVFDPAKQHGCSLCQCVYVANMMDDLFYCYGFTESAFNFQYHNTGKGGAQNDQVYQLSVQVSKKTVFNDAAFFIPGDGVNGELRLYPWNKTTLYRDIAFDNHLFKLVDEYTHGLAGRLVSGNCRFLAVRRGSQTTAESAAADLTLGTYVNPKSLRHYLYSTGITTDPLTYGSLQTRTEIHAAGEVWANI
ncbi:unnamed protein product [Rhizoctonia solani]|uniref:Extracellular metalloproteinase n=1 Tax=Rhizoctonia solani TaxID=456999 RepID=A0A8H3DR27_9AGAM|nr:unnamed protein product [Rhizoctonia solani]